MNYLIAFSIALLGLTSCQTNPNQTQVQTLKQTDLSQKLAEENVVLMDVRTPEEVAQGSIEGASLFINIYDTDFETQINKLDSTKTYVVYCRSGGRSSKAANLMVKNGFKSVYNLEGGITAYTGTIKK